MGSSGGVGTIGDLEFYDPVTETFAFSTYIWGHTNDYHGGAITPGTYKIKWVPSEFGGSPPIDQWYPNATTITDAMPVAIAAGDDIQNICFFYPPILPDRVDLDGTLSMDPDSDTMSVGVQTVEGVLYAFEKSLSAEEGTWFPIEVFTGNGGIMNSEDLQAIDPFSFYRFKRMR